MAVIMRQTLVWTGIGGSPAVGTFFFAAGAEDSQAVSDAVAAWAGANSGSQPSNVLWTTGDTVSLVDSTTGNVTGVISVTAANGGGSASGGSLPRACQVLSELRTGVFQSGREIRGRVNLPYPAASQLGTNGQVSATCLERTLDAAAALMEDSETFPWVVWSRKTGQVPTITQVSAWPEFAVIRSRRD